MMLPKPLKPGACVGLIAPSSPVTPEEREDCVTQLKDMGFLPQLGEALGQDNNLRGYLAGNAADRAADVNRMFADPRIDGIFCVRGGYGSSQILEFLDYPCIRRNPKAFVGYSDVTSLHMAFQKYCGLITLHGPMVKPNLLPRPDAYTKKSLLAAGDMGACMAFENPPGEELQAICPGSAEGFLVGGNLSVIARSLGTAFAPETRGGILFLEDVGESIPHIDMYLTQMRYAGIFTGVNGILLGGFLGEQDADINAFLADWFRLLGVPVLGNVWSDHRKPMGTLPMGAWCRMEAGTGRMGTSELIFFNYGKQDCPIPVLPAASGTGYR